MMTRVYIKQEQKMVVFDLCVNVFMGELLKAESVWYRTDYLVQANIRQSTP